MSTYVDFTFCELPETPYKFDVDKFKAGDTDQMKLYKDAKAVIDNPNFRDILDKIYKN